MNTMNHLVSAHQLDEGTIIQLIEQALEYKHTDAWFPKQSVIAANLFFEPSTRTHKSFEVAQKRLGLEVINFQAESSSVTKGETLYDTVLTMQALGVDLMVIRHPEADYYEELIASPSITAQLINGGDGSGQHPTQCLLDLMTLYEEFGDFHALKILITGDLAHSRVARSNAYLLHLLGAQLYFSGPQEWYESYYDDFGQYVAIDEVIHSVDAIMLLRVQAERHHVADTQTATYLSTYGLSIERYNALQSHAILLHPAPVNRGVEIDGTLVESDKSRIVLQMTNGVYMRMAIMAQLLANKESTKGMISWQHS